MVALLKRITSFDEYQRVIEEDPDYGSDE